MQDEPSLISPNPPPSPCICDNTSTLLIFLLTHRATSPLSLWTCRSHFHSCESVGLPRFLSRSYLLSRGPRWSLCNRHFPRGWDRLGFYLDKQWLLRNNHRGPRLNKYDPHLLVKMTTPSPSHYIFLSAFRAVPIIFMCMWRIHPYLPVNLKGAPHTNVTMSSHLPGNPKDVFAFPCGTVFTQVQVLFNPPNFTHTHTHLAPTQTPCSHTDTLLPHRHLAPTQTPCSHTDTLLSHSQSRLSVWYVLIHETKQLIGWSARLIHFA